MCDLSEKFKHLEVSSDLFKDVKFYVTGEICDDIIELLTKGGADQSKYFSDFVTHLICGENPEETDIIDATDVYEVPAVSTKWILLSSQLNRLVSTKPFLFNRPQIFSSKTFCLSKVKDDLDTLWALITYNGGKVQLTLDQNCDYLVTVDTNTSKYEKALSLGPHKICIVTPDWILECIKSNAVVQPDLFHPRLIDWPKPPPPVHHESTTAITGFEESEMTEKDNANDEVANSTQALLEKLKQRMPWNQPEQPQAPQQPQQPKNEQNLHSQKEIVPPNVVAPSFQQKQAEQPQSQQMLSHQQILQKLQMSQSQNAKSSMSNIPQQMTPEQQQMVQNALQQAQQNIHSQRMSQQNLLSNQQQQQSSVQSSQIGFSQQNQGSQANLSQPQQGPLQSPSPLQQSPVAQQGPRAVLHHLPQGQQLQFQQNANINRNINRPSLQQLRGQLGTTQLQQQLLQQQQQRLNQQQQQQQQNVLQRTQLTLQQQQLLQLQLQQGQISQARQLLQQNQQQMNLNQTQSIQPTISQNQQILSGNQMINTQHLTPSQLSQLQNRAQQLNQQKLAQNHQISQLLAQRQAQLSQRLSQQLSSEQLLQNQQIGQPPLAGQPINQNQQIQLAQNRMANQNQQHLQQLKLVQQQQQQNQQTSQNQQLGQGHMDHGQIGGQDQQLGQIQQQQQNQMGQVQVNQGMVQNQQINQGMVQNQQMNQNLNQNQRNQGLAQNQQQQGLNQGHLNQNQQLLQSLGQNQQLNQNQLNESLGQSQQMTQTQRLLQSQQLNPQITQTQQADQNQQQLTETPRQQINLGLNHILNQQINQGNLVAQQRLNQNQLINQQLNQLNQQLSQSQISHQQIPQSPIAQSPNQQFGNIIQQQQQLQNQQQQLQNQQQQLQNQQQQLQPQQQQILAGNPLTQVRQVVGGNQQIIQQQQFGQNQQQFGQQEGAASVQQQLLSQQQGQFAQQGQQAQPARPHLQQQLWTQQQGQQQAPGQPQIPRQTLSVQQGQRVQQWAPGGQQAQGVQPRQFIHLDAQTHNQLQKMPPEQQALFIARLQQKQRQLMLKQAQQRGSGHILIRGPVPAGLNPQQQMAWLQQQANKQGVVLPTNLQQQTVSSTTMNQQQAGPSQTPGPSGLNQTPGLSPIQQTPAQVQDQNQLKLKQLRLQQLQREQLQKAAATPGLQQAQQPGMSRPLPQAPIAEPQVPIQDPSVGQSQVLVNPKTKTALANMLSIRLQSGGNAVGAVQDPIPEPSASGTLRLMTAQHNASLNANNRPLDLLAMQQQRRALGGPNGEIRQPAPQPLPVAPQGDQQPVQSSPKASSSSTVPLQHRPGPFYGHNPNLKLPEDKFLLGCVFVVAEVEDILKEMMPNFKKKVQKHGGEVEQQYCARVTHILCLTQRHGIVMQALRDCKRCVTLYWLEDVIRRRQLLPPWIALHVPMIYIDTMPCSKYLISSSGFEGQERDRVHQMIRNVGGKYTEYFSKHNTLLVAARLKGNKVKKAKGWNIPIVNIQWLTDVLLGNYAALQQMDNVVYQQYNEPPNFSFDPKLCPNIMHGWKMPINISQEAYEKVKKAPPPRESVLEKRARQLEAEGDSTEEEDDEDDDEEWSTEDDSSDEMDKGDAMVDEDGPVQNPEYHIMFSAVLYPLEDLVEMVKSLNGSSTNNYRECTHLVMEHLDRTIKLLLCIPRQIPIVPLKWLTDSKAAGKFLDPAHYPFENVEDFNRTFGCDINALLRTPDRNRLFQGKSFWVTPRVFPNEKMVRRVIEFCGGVIEEVRRTAAQIEATNQTAPHSYFIVTVEKDIHLTGDLLRNKKEKVKYICNAELVFHAVMTQEIEIEPWAIQVAD